MKKQIKRIVSLLCIFAIALSMFVGTSIFSAFADVVYKDSYSISFEEGDYDGSDISQMPTNRYAFSTDFAHDGSQSLQTKGNKNDARFLFWDNEGDPVNLEQGVYYEVSFWYYVDTQNTTSVHIGFLASKATGPWTGGATFLNYYSAATYSQFSIAGCRADGWQRLKGYVCIPTSLDDSLVNLAMRFGTNDNSWIYFDDFTVTKIDSTNDVTVSFNSNGGTSCTAITTKPVERITLPNPTRSGYIFGGWYEDAELTYAVSDYAPKASTTYYAKWIIDGVDYDFDTRYYRSLDSGYAGSENRLSATNMTYRWTYSNYPPNVSGYALCYDYQNSIDKFGAAAGVSSYAVAAVPDQRLTSDMTYEAVFRVYIESKGSTASQLRLVTSANTFSTTYEKTQGETISLSDYKAGEWYEISYRFTASPYSSTRNYLYLSAMGNDVFYVDELRIYRVPSDTITSTVTFVDGSSVSSVSGNAGAALTFPTEPTKEGYTFGGWYADRNFSVKFTRTTIPFENVTLYARWLLENKKENTIEFTGDYSSYLSSNYSASQYKTQTGSDVESVADDINSAFYSSSALADENVISGSLSATETGFYYNAMSDSLASASNGAPLSEVLDGESGVDIWNKWESFISAEGAALVYVSGAPVKLTANKTYRISYDYTTTANTSSIKSTMYLGTTAGNLSGSIQTIESVTLETSSSAKTVSLEYVPTTDCYLVLGFNGVSRVEVSNFDIEIYNGEIDDLVYTGTEDTSTTKFFTLPAADNNLTPLGLEKDAKYIVTVNYSAKNVGNFVTMSLFSIDNKAYSSAAMVAVTKHELVESIHIAEDVENTSVTFAFRTNHFENTSLALGISGLAEITIDSVEIKALPDTYSVITFTYGTDYIKPIYGLVGETITMPDMSYDADFGGWYRDELYFKEYSTVSTLAANYNVDNLYGYNSGGTDIGFENGYPIQSIDGCISSEYWSIVDDESLAHSGKSVAVYKNDTTTSATRFGIMLANGDRSLKDYHVIDSLPYVVTFWYNCVSTGTQGEYYGEVANNISLYLQDTASATAVSAETSQKVLDVIRNYGVTDGWVKVSVAFTAEVTTFQRSSLVLKVSGGSTIYFDDFNIQPYPLGTNIAAFAGDGAYIEPIISEQIGATYTLPDAIKNGYELDHWYTLADQAVVLYDNTEITTSSPAVKSVLRPVETPYTSATNTHNGTVTYHASWKPIAFSEGFDDGINTGSDFCVGDFTLTAADTASGSGALKYSATSDIESIIKIGESSEIALEDGQRYIAYAYVKNKSGSVKFDFATTDVTSVSRSVNVLTNKISTTSNEWTLLYDTFVYSAVDHDFALALRATGTGVSYIDGIYIVKAPTVSVASGVTNGSITFDEENLTVTVAPNSGYQLAVNSLVMTYSGAGDDVSKKLFNKGDATELGQGSGYTFSYRTPYGKSFETVSVSAEFVADTSIGVVASSIRIPDYNMSAGIRFRGRINSETAGKITVGGTEYDITSYGFMVVPQQILDMKGIDAASGWTLDTANATSTIIADNTDVVYDKTGKYIDVQVMITGIEQLVSYDMTTKLYVKYLDASGNEQVVYSAPYSKSYNDVLSVTGLAGKTVEKVVDFEEYIEIVDDMNYVGENFRVATDNVQTGSVALKYSGYGSIQDFASLYDNTNMIHLEDNTTYNVTVSYSVEEASEGTVDLYAVCNGRIQTVGYKKLAEIASVSTLSEYVTTTVEFTTGVLGNYNILAIGSNAEAIVCFDNIKVVNGSVVTFVSERGEAIPSVSQSVGTNFTLPTPVEESNEFKFEGWYLDQNYTTKFTDTYFPGENTTLYAKWVRNKYVQDFETYPFDGGTAALYGSELTPYNSEVSGYDSAYVRSGAAAFKKPVTTKNGQAIALFTEDMRDGGLEVGKTYLLKFWMYVQTSSGGELIVRQTTGSAYGYNGEIARVSISSLPTNTWVMKTLEVTIAEGTQGFSIVHNNCNAAVIYYDDIEVVGEYELTWSDEFDGTSLNLDYWTYNRQNIPSYTQLSDGSIRYLACRRNDNPNNTYIATGDEATNYTNLLNANFPSSYIGDSSDVDGKYLVLRGLQQDVNLKDNLSGTRLEPDDVYGYSSASFQTKDKVEYLYGYLEMRCIIPFGKGLWPAFWPCGSDLSLQKPYGNEYDIFESNSSGMAFAANLHSSITGDGMHGYHFNALDYKSVMNSTDVESGSGRAWYFNYGGTPGITNTTEYSLANYRQQFHTIGMEWTPEFISFACDGNKFFQVDITSDRWEAYHELVQIKVSMSVGNVEGALPNEETQFPAHFVIDYIRLYQRPGVGYLVLN